MRHTLSYDVFSKVLLSVLVVCFICMSCGCESSGSTSNNSDANSESELLRTNDVFDEIVPIVSDDAVMEPGTEYAYMASEGSVFIATAISDNVLKIEKWFKGNQLDENLKYEYDLGSFRIQEKENGFSWIDPNHTAFTFVIQDKYVSAVKKPTTVIFTIDISETDKDKGTDYDNAIACYSYINDDWHTYRAIALSDSLIKVECWFRSNSGASVQHRFAWDVGVIDTINTNTDFEWGDVNHKAFSITMKDPKNKYYWKEEKLVSFVLENDSYEYSDVLAFLNRDDRINQDETASGVEDANPAIPVMSGSSLTEAEAVMKQYKVYKSFDTDFGHGTIDRSYVNDDWSYMVDIIYLDETKEILYGDIVTSKLATSEQQQEFIKSMAEVLCPKASVEEVSEWVGENLGEETDITIDGFSYELSFNPTTHSLIYSAGRVNWEEWDLSF